MKYLSPMSGELMQLRHPLLGAMRTPDNDRGLPPGMSWGGDCGIKVAISNDPTDVERYLTKLHSWRTDLPSCLFAVAPDVLGDAAACWERSAPLLPRIRALGYPAAFVAQDGFDPSAVDWDAFDVLFIGGAPKKLRRLEWKRAGNGGMAAIHEARRRGKQVHVGRVNGEPFLRALAARGVRSADGTKLRYGPVKNWPMVRGWLDRLISAPPSTYQPSLWERAS